MRMSIRLPLATCAVLASCGDDASSSPPPPSGLDISGVYEVTAHTASYLSCDDDGTPASEPSHFAVRAGSVRGYYAVACASATSCPTAVDAAFSGDFIANLDTVESDGWSSTLAASFALGADCTLSYDVARATLATDGTLAVEVWRYADHVPSADPACSRDEAEGRNTSMGCVVHERIAGAPL